MNGSKRRIKPEQDYFNILREIKQSEEIIMETILSSTVEVRTRKNPKELLGESIILVLETSESIWFRIMEVGTDEENGQGYIKGYDIERMNRTIYFNEINYIVI